MTKKVMTSAQQTMRAALLNRRTVLKSAAAIGAVGLAAPMFSRNAFSSSGELNLLMWSDEFPDPVIPNFEAATGIKVNQTPFSQNEEQINKLQATGGEGFDLCQPTRNRAPQYKDLGVLAPFDMNKITNTGNLIPSFLKSAEELWTWEDGMYYVPHVWGTEALSYRTDLYPGDVNNLSFGSLWDEAVKGHTQGRGHSFLLGIGLWWDGSGKMPTNRMLDGYKDEDSFKKVWDPILAFAIENKSFVKQFWDSADNTKSGLMENDVWIGQTWDGPVLSLKKEGKPVNYTAPKEGAIAWLDGLSRLSASKNDEQIYAFINYLLTPEVSGQLAEGSGYNPVITGADAFTSDVYKKNFQDAFPGDALAKVWHWPAEPSWYAEIRSQYVQQFQAA
ncbi:spermidine/putrescine transport system substrate-binding protein [Dongia mobilis]|uniref:Spermidine/putrescine transport system substrate-binding protein n=1 Tax=Dongia mobilis TaxID=578943 RepID=A0A4R6WKF8_9PROT|nr:extracellular solute-binding protein [Dongia mobilis]TDQ81016.1 spermidine/putrescine transport system substrate-binding protein [Dongia mobilis]